MQQYFLWHKDQQMYFQVPSSWEVLLNVTCELQTTGKTVYQMTSESIANPIGVLPLEKPIKPTDRVVIIADDLTRPTPKKKIFKCRFDHLTRLRVKDHQVDILFGIWILPSNISIRFQSHNCPYISRIDSPISPLRTLNRYFEHQTRWYLQCLTACEKFLNSFTEYFLSIFRVALINILRSILLTQISDLSA